MYISMMKFHYSTWIVHYSMVHSNHALCILQLGTTHFITHYASCSLVQWISTMYLALCTLVQCTVIIKTATLYFSHPPSTMLFEPWYSSLRLSTLHLGTGNFHHPPCTLLVRTVYFHHEPYTLIQCTSAMTHAWCTLVHYISTMHSASWYVALPPWTTHHAAWNGALLLFMVHHGTVQFDYAPCIMHHGMV